jgi:thymidylate kinase
VLGGMPVTILPCYVDMAAARELPEAFAVDSRGQLDSLEFYLDLDRERNCALTASGGSLVVADRSWLTLLGHTHAVAECGGPSAYSDALKRVEEVAPELFQPDLVLVLAADPETLRSRTPTDDLEKWFADPNYNEAFLRFMTEIAPAVSVAPLEFVDGDAGAEKVAEAARSAIERHLAPSS